MPDSFTTDLSRREAILRDSEIRYRRLFETAKDGILILNATTGKVTDANPFMTTLLGYSHDEFVGKELWEIGLFRDIDENRAAYRELKENGYVRYAHLPLESTNGDKVDVEFVSNVYDENLQQVIQCNIRVITQRMAIERELKASLRAKEVQVRDVHHRVKNNLQIISSLLSLQAGYTTDPVLVRLLRESQNRIQSMALIHESLYSSQDHTRIDFTSYVRQLFANLDRCYGATGDHIRLDSDIEPTGLGLDYAIPCGLILNELIANCLKHAFPSGRQGEIFVRLRSNGAGEIILSVSDNGVGLPPDLDLIRGRSLGLRLVRSLCEQLHGSFEVQRDSGTRFDIRFRDRNLPKDQTK